MRYENIKKAKIKNADIAKAFGYSSVHSFNKTSAHARMMVGVDEILGLQIENIKSKI